MIFLIAWYFYHRVSFGFQPRLMSTVIAHLHESHELSCGLSLPVTKFTQKSPLVSQLVQVWHHYYHYVIFWGHLSYLKLGLLKIAINTPYVHSMMSIILVLLRRVYLPSFVADVRTILFRLGGSSAVPWASDFLSCCLDMLERLWKDVDAVVDAFAWASQTPQ